MNYGLTQLQRAKWQARRWYHKVLKNIRGVKPIQWSDWVQKTYILHLEDREDRKQALTTELEKVRTSNGTLANEVTWFPALYNVESWPSKWHINEYDFDFHWVIDPDPYFHQDLDELNKVPIDCSAAETAIALGHLKMWKTFLESDAEVAMFLEDDVYFDYKFEEKAESIFTTELPSDWDILYLGALPNYHGFTWDPHSKNLLRLFNGVWWMSSYVLTRKAAQHLLDNLPIVGPVDVWINYQFEGMKVFMTNGNLITQTGVEDSDNTYSFVEEYG